MYKYAFTKKVRIDFVIENFLPPPVEEAPPAPAEPIDESIEVNLVF